MAEHPDVALVRRGYAAFSAGDMATLSELLAEDARQYQPGSGSVSGEYRGRDAILAFYARLASETNGTFRVVLEGVYTDGEGRVVASSQTTAQRGSHWPTDRHARQRQASDRRRSAQDVLDQGWRKRLLAVQHDADQHASETTNGDRPNAKQMQRHQP